MNILSRFMNWARGGSSQPEQVEVPVKSSTVIVPDIPDFDNLTKKEIVEWVEEKYGDKLSMRKTKAQLVEEAKDKLLETTSVA